jgi:uncharacterized protein (TIGR02646 family)
MRYIEKGQAPNFFTAEIASFDKNTSWNDLHCKAHLRRHLKQEQAHLCAYCESGLNDSNSHIEHIEPQSTNSARRFDYTNLVASCDGDVLCSEQNVYRGLDVASCGHRKDDRYDPGLFLNPTQLTDVEKYFQYDLHDASISASDKMPEKASYMIDLLNLDNQYLRNSRSNARAAVLSIVGKSRDKMTIQRILQKPRPFISFLKACFG